MLRVFILLLLPLASTNISQEELNDYDLLTNFTKYNDPDLSHVLDQAIPSTIYNYITNKYMNDDNSIENEPALIYELGKAPRRISVRRNRSEPIGSAEFRRFPN
ncbi:unnamed protein product [Rotaria magnacalcarata]|uniref:Uncharacterized protein n=1 Tax=Rotaria magnacalcarata TaxID=392030 RepID=A0A816GLT8_9BILA|nr:unnamed protein product [Rotaria magnacalcarata]CAF3990901.1 unnamed protein product [Rotaria magnacalcarata]